MSQVYRYQTKDAVVKERPILFSAEMVRAILDERKWMTRREIKFDKPFNSPNSWKVVDYARDGMPIFWGNAAPPKNDPIRTTDYYDEGKPCPYGKVGDRLWVRETWRETEDIDGRPVMEYRAGGTRLIVGKSIRHGEHRATSILPKWRPSIFMPRWASRIVLELTCVKVERLQEITEEDAIAEGCQCAGVPASLTNRGAFAKAPIYLAHLDLRLFWKKCSDLWQGS